MNEKQKDSFAKYLYDISKAMNIGWLIGFATDKISWQISLVLAIVALNLFYTAYRLEVKNV